MYNIYKFKEQPLLVFTDIHGYFDAIENHIESHDIRNCVMVIAGDIGLGFKPFNQYIDIFGKINKFLRLRNITLLLLRGNHDDPTYFSEGKINFSNVKTIPDYSIISIYYEGDDNFEGLPKFNVLCVGGGVSIDRLRRIDGFESRKKLFKDFFPNATDEEVLDKVYPSYWVDEIPIYREDILDEIKNDGINIEHVITHTCPSFCFPTHKNNIQLWLKIDEGLNSILDYERTTMSLIYNKIIEDKHTLTSWVYGHFHWRHDETIKGVKFITLDNADKMFDLIEIEVGSYEREVE